MAYEEDEVQVEETDFEKPQEEPARLWPFGFGAIVLAAIWLPATIWTGMCQPLFQKERAEIIEQANKAASVISIRDMSETRNNLARLLVNEADKYGLEAMQVGDAVTIRLKKNSR